jgi:hypothetical protein
VWPISALHFLYCIYKNNVGEIVSCRLLLKQYGSHKSICNKRFIRYSIWLFCNALRVNPRTSCFYLYFGLDGPALNNQSMSLDTISQLISFLLACFLFYVFLILDILPHYKRKTVTRFCYQSNPHRPLINRLRPFCKWNRIRRDNRFEKYLQYTV